MGAEGAYGIGSDQIPGLAKLIEEAGELTQALAKVMALGHMGRHWDGTHLRTRLVEEMGDVRAAMIFFCEANNIDKGLVHDRADVKLVQFRYWHKARLDNDGVEPE
jgi:NTP pyrophosphatase (non-canonical NTP hydrolase)